MTINAEIAIYLAQALNMFALIALAIWFVVPKLRDTGRAKGLMALTSVHLGRSLCLEIYSSQDAGMKMANNTRDQIVVGDLLGWVLALIILFCLAWRLKFSVFLIWLLAIETVVDMGLGTIALIQAGTIGNVNGTSWLIVAFYLPIVQVAVGLSIWQLITRRNEPLFAA